MLLKGRFRVTERYRSKTKVSFWEDLEVGDVVEISVLVKKDYLAEQLMLYNGRTKENHQTYFNVLATYLSKLGYEELDHGWNMAADAGVYRGVNWAIKQIVNETYNAGYLFTIVEPDGSHGGSFDTLDKLIAAVDKRLAC
jgi:hypothetical protein